MEEREARQRASGETAGSSAGTASGSAPTEPRTDLRYISGLHIPQEGTEIHFGKYIIGVRTNDGVDYYTHEEQITVLSRKRRLDPQNPEQLYEVRHVTADQWIGLLTAYSDRVEIGDWLVHTARVLLTRRQVEQQRSQWLAENASLSIGRSGRQTSLPPITFVPSTSTVSPPRFIPSPTDSEDLPQCLPTHRTRRSRTSSGSSFGFGSGFGSGSISSSGPLIHQEPQVERVDLPQCLPNIIARRQRTSSRENQQTPRTARRWDILSRMRRSRDNQDNDQ